MNSMQSSHCMSAAQQLKREQSVVGVPSPGESEGQSGGTLANR